MAFHKAVDRDKLFRPPFRIDFLCVAIFVFSDHVRPNRIGEVDDGIAPFCKFHAHEGFSGAWRTCDAAHHNELITVTNRSFSQSSPTLTRI